MTRREPQDVLKVLLAQAAEDRAIEEEMRAVAAMSDDALDAELAGFGIEPAEVLAQARRVLAAAKVAPLEATEAPHVAAAVAQAAPVVLEKPAKRRRPIVLWLAAAAGIATIGAGVYAALHHREAPAPQPPGPGPVPMPAPSSSAPETPRPQDLIAAKDLRTRAAAALAKGHPSECLELLDDARNLDPAGDAVDEVRAMRKRAIDGIKWKP